MQSTPIGRTEALRALGFVMENAASPMETVLALLLCLPYRLGGYGIEKPQFNYRVDVPTHIRKLADRRYCECDLCWPGSNLAAEYDSARYHVEPRSARQRRAKAQHADRVGLHRGHGDARPGDGRRRVQSLGASAGQADGQTASVQRPGFHAQAPRIAVGVVADIRTQGGCAMSVLFEEMEIGSLRA